MKKRLLPYVFDRAEVVNLASNTLYLHGTKSLTAKGIRMLAKGVLDLDREYAVVYSLLEGYLSEKRKKA